MNRIFSKKFPNDIQLDALHKLRMLNRATILNDLEVLPSNRLEPSRGIERDNTALRATPMWKIYSRWLNGDALDVEVIDYH